MGPTPKGPQGPPGRHGDPGIALPDEPAVWIRTVHIAKNDDKTYCGRKTTEVRTGTALEVDCKVCDRHITEATLEALGGREYVQRKRRERRDHEIMMQATRAEAYVHGMRQIRDRHKAEFEQICAEERARLRAEWKVRRNLR